MEIAVLLSAGLRDWIDLGVIIGILMLNAAVGWYQEKQAADVVASLKGDIAMKCTVVRQGQESGILARELVPGDIVSLSPNIPYLVPALISFATGHHRRRSNRPCRCSRHLRLRCSRRLCQVQGAQRTAPAQPRRRPIWIRGKGW